MLIYVKKVLICEKRWYKNIASFQLYQNVVFCEIQVIMQYNLILSLLLLFEILRMSVKQAQLRMTGGFIVIPSVARNLCNITLWDSSDVRQVSPTQNDGYSPSTWATLRMTGGRWDSSIATLGKPNSEWRVESQPYFTQKGTKKPSQGGWRLLV